VVSFPVGFGAPRHCIVFWTTRVVLLLFLPESLDINEPSATSDVFPPPHSADLKIQHDEPHRQLVIFHRTQFSPALRKNSPPQGSHLFSFPFPLLVPPKGSLMWQPTQGSVDLLPIFPLHRRTPSPLHFLSSSHAEPYSSYFPTPFFYAVPERRSPPPLFLFTNPHVPLSFLANRQTLPRTFLTTAPRYPPPPSRRVSSTPAVLIQLSRYIPLHEGVCAFFHRQSFQNDCRVANDCCSTFWSRRLLPSFRPKNPFSPPR